MPKELKDKFKELTYAGYYEDDHTYTIEIQKNKLISFLAEIFQVDNIKII